ncbi:MAG: alpha/beta hydrolase [Oscillospiraceae bacterium]|nr:alpha/beta hydrolase [Oscillospiraceae bacterium]
MLFNEIKDNKLPTIILLHGGGLSNWSLSNVAKLLEKDYNVVTPIIDGHGEDGNEDFISIEDSAKKLLEYIAKNHNGKVFAIGGLSLGAQIATEVLSQREDIAQYAILESSLVIPLSKWIISTIVPTYKLSYGLIKQKWFAKIQAKSLLIPDEMFEEYFADSLKLSKQSLINFTISNATYKLKDSIGKTKATVLIIVGEKEIGLMKKSGEALKNKIPNSKLYCAQNMKHGELSIVHPEEYVKVIKNFFIK